MRVTQYQSVQTIVGEVNNNHQILEYAKNIATAIVNGPHNHCAATLSALLVFSGIYPNGGGTGSGDLEPWVPALAFDLEKRRGWSRIAYDKQAGPAQAIGPGDVGVVLVDANTHHIYLVLDATDQASPLIADNQLGGPHKRSLAGDPAQSFSPTSYFLRAP